MELLFIFLTLWLLEGMDDGEKSDLVTNEENYVIIITIDGFPSSLLWDRLAPIPTIRSLARDGAWSIGMRSTNPTLTWPNHTTLVTGVDASKHHVLYNGKLEKRAEGIPVSVNPRQDKTDLTNAETIYDAAFKAGLKTAEVNWPVTRNAGTLHDSFPDVPDNVKHMTPDLLWEIYEEGILEDMTTFALWQHSSPGRDAVWVSTAIHLIHNRMPNLLLLHLLHVDNTHHRIGLNTKPGYSALALSDYMVKDILAALDSAGVRDRTTIFIVSDHGFTATSKTILPNVILANAGFLELSEDDRIVGGKAQAVANGGFASIYLSDPNDAESAELIKKLFEGQEGIHLVITPEEYSEHGLPHPSQTSQIGELVLFSEPGYGMSGSLQGELPVVSSAEYGFSLGHHGFHADFSQMNAVFVASGYGIKKGVELDLINNISVAPTAAYLLGIDLPDADGEPLKEILDHDLLKKLSAATEVN